MFSSPHLWVMLLGVFLALSFIIAAVIYVNKLFVTQTVGTFTTAKGVVKGLTSGAQWTLSEAGDNMTPFDTIFEDIADNKRIEDEANEFINFSETNPFGEP